MNQDELRRIPGVDTLLERTSFPDAIPEPVRSSLIRNHLDELRERVQNGQSCPPTEQIVQAVEDRAEELDSNRIQPVINATGVVLHTNLGRAPYHDRIAGDVRRVSTGYSNLEMDLSTGERGGRGRFGEILLSQLCGAEEAGIVNNCSAALFLALKTLAEERAVLISRGELVQIGGGFRIPQILESSGARLREIGTTNRTTVEDFREGIDEEVGLILKVHRSNFRIQGFTETPDPAQLAQLAHRHDIPFLSDLGSGALWKTEKLGLEAEPRPEQMIERGADLVTFSGDKLMGGPQAGLFVGKSEPVRAMVDHPLFRALRCGKATLTALESTLIEYARDGGRSLPVQQLFAASPDDLRQRADALFDRLDEPEPVSVDEMEGTVGGGSLPGSRLSGWGLTIDCDDCERLQERLRRADPPLIARIREGRVQVNLRSIPPGKDETVASILDDVLSGS